jgi:hypothetical protein
MMFLGRPGSAQPTATPESPMLSIITSPAPNKLLAPARSTACTSQACLCLRRLSLAAALLQHHYPPQHSRQAYRFLPPIYPALNNETPAFPNQSHARKNNTTADVPNEV